jgi:hypothetical protein
MTSRNPHDRPGKVRALKESGQTKLQKLSDLSKRKSEDRVKALPQKSSISVKRTLLLLFLTASLLAKTKEQPVFIIHAAAQSVRDAAVQVTAVEGYTLDSEAEHQIVVANP